MDLNHRDTLSAIAGVETSLGGRGRDPGSAVSRFFDRAKELAARSRGNDVGSGECTFVAADGTTAVVDLQGFDLCANQLNVRSNRDHDVIIRRHPQTGRGPVSAGLRSAGRRAGLVPRRPDRPAE